MGVGLATATKYIGILSLPVCLVILYSDKKIATWKNAAILCLTSGGLYCASYFYWAAADYSLFEWIQLQWEGVKRGAGPWKSHRYGSRPAQWLFNGKAVWYHFHREDGIVRGMAELGNPVV